MPESSDSLHAIAHAFPQAFATKDIEQIVSFFADDSVSMYPGYPLPAYGKEGSRTTWTNYFNNYATHPVTTDSVVVAASNDVGYSTGRWASAEQEGEGVFAGRYTTVWRHRDGKWEIVIISAHVHQDIRPFKFQTLSDDS